MAYQGGLQPRALESAMRPMRGSPTILDDFTRDLIGLPITHVWRGHYSALFIEFGELTPSKHIRTNGSRGNPGGRFGLMIDAGWRLEKDRSILCGSTSDDHVIDNQTSILKGLFVEKIEVHGRLPELNLQLSANTYVVTFKSDEENSEWALADRRAGPPPWWLCVKDGELELELDAGTKTKPTAD